MNRKSVEGQAAVIVGSGYAGAMASAQRADAAVAATGPGLQGPRELVRGVVDDLRDAFSGFRKKPVGLPVEPVHAPPARPPFLVSRRLTGGAELLGVAFGAAEAIVPAWLPASIGDLTAEPIESDVRQRPLAPYIRERLRERAPTHEPFPAETDPEIVARLLVEVAATTLAFRTHVFNAGLSQNESALVHEHFDELLRHAVQDLCAPADHAARRVWSTWHAGALSTEAGGRSPQLNPRVAHRAAFITRTCHITLAGLMSRARELAAEPWLYTGARHARIVAELELERTAAAASVEAATKREAFLDCVRRGTPRELGLIVASRPIDPRRAQALQTGAGPAQTVRIGDREFILARRRSPSVIAFPAATAIQNISGVDVGFVVIADDEPLELLERHVEQGQRTRAPRWLLDAVLFAARACVAKTSPQPIVDFIDRRDASECRRRMAILRKHLDAVADIFHSPDPMTAAVDMNVLTHFAIVACRIDPVLYAHELGRRSKTIDVSERVRVGFEIARSPATWFFTVDQAAEGDRG